MTGVVARWMMTRIPGLAIACGLILVGSLDAIAAREFVVLLGVAAIVLLVPHPDVLGVAMAILLGAAALVGSMAAFLIAGAVTSVALVVRQLMAGESRNGVSVWLAVGALCVGAAFVRYDVGTPPSESAVPPIAASELDSEQMSDDGSDLLFEPAMDLEAELRLSVDPRLVLESNAMVQLSEGSSSRSIVSVRTEPGSAASTSWWMALLMFVLGVVSLRTLHRFRRLDAAHLAAVAPNAHVERFERLGRSHGVTRAPNESVLQFAERLAASVGDPHLLDLGGLISAELYGESSSRRIDAMQRLFDSKE